jgi:hypothetical protein
VVHGERVTDDGSRFLRNEKKTIRFGKIVAEPLNHCRSQASRPNDALSIRTMAVRSSRVARLMLSLFVADMHWLLELATSPICRMSAQTKASRSDEPVLSLPFKKGTLPAWEPIQLTRWTSFKPTKRRSLARITG